MGLEITRLRHPKYIASLSDWEKFRLTFKGGKKFIDKYLKVYSKFENKDDFDERRAITYNPAHAKGAVRMVINAIFQRLVDVERSDGSDSYKEAILGKNGGVDLQGRTMTAFLGDKVLPELLPIQKVFIYVDMPVIAEGASQADTIGKRPYIYTYTAEEVPSWLEDNSSSPGKFKTILLKRFINVIDVATGLPVGKTPEYRLLTKKDAGVVVKIYDKNGVQTGVQLLKIPQIPVVEVDLGQSLLEDIADYQISALQLASSDVNHLTRSNFAIYTEQYDPRYDDWKLGPAHPAADGTTDASGLPTTLEQRQTRMLEGDTTLSAEADRESNRMTGTTKGVGYQKGLDRPGFINPSPDPTKVSMAKQKEMAEEIRELVDLSLSSLGAKYASAESKKTDQLGLEAGLSFIGLVLQQAEMDIAELWAMYEGSKPANIVYPRNYSLRTDEDRRQEAEEYSKLGDKTTSVTYQREIQKRVSDIVLGHRLSPEEMDGIFKEIDEAPGTASDAKDIIEDHKEGLVSDETASRLRGYSEGEAKQAQEDHANRAAKILQAQTRMSERGVDDLDPSRKDGQKSPGVGRGPGAANEE